jgi:hypothetical protein
MPLAAPAGTPSGLPRAGKDPRGRFERGDLGALPLPDASVMPLLCALALVRLPDLRPLFRPSSYRRGLP